MHCEEIIRRQGFEISEEKVGEVGSCRLKFVVKCLKDENQLYHTVLRSNVYLSILLSRHFVRCWSLQEVINGAILLAEVVGQDIRLCNSYGGVKHQRVIARHHQPEGCTKEVCFVTLSL